MLVAVSQGQVSFEITELHKRKLGSSLGVVKLSWHQEYAESLFICHGFCCYLWLTECLPEPRKLPSGTEESKQREGFFRGFFFFFIKGCGQIAFTVLSDRKKATLVSRALCVRSGGEAGCRDRANKILVFIL